MEAASTQIWCDICQAGFGVWPLFFHCCPGPVMLKRLNQVSQASGHPHAECDTEWLINRSQWKCAWWQEGVEDKHIRCHLIVSSGLYLFSCICVSLSVNTSGSFHHLQLICRLSCCLNKYCIVMVQ